MVQNEKIFEKKSKVYVEPVYVEQVLNYFLL